VKSEGATLYAIEEKTGKQRRAYTDPKVALDSKKGDVLWRRSLPGAAGAPTAGQDGTVFVDCADGNLYPLDGKTGLIFMTSTDQNIYAIRASDGQTATEVIDP
jgi:outer membrane protein assembly factor BamB